MFKLTSLYLWNSIRDKSYIFACVFWLSVSNEIPEHPCVSPASGHVFERRLIEKYIAENGTDPITGDVLSEEQLIEVKGKLTYYILLYIILYSISIIFGDHRFYLLFYLASPLVKPRPPSATSIPAILKGLQDEWVCSKTFDWLIYTHEYSPC